jgi:site-specific recombinase XerD
LKTKDLGLGKKEPMIHVRNGKGKKTRYVNISQELRKHLKEFLAWKKRAGDDISEDGYLFPSRDGKPYTLNGIQKRFKAVAKEAGLRLSYSIHACRHSYGTYLYERTRDLRLVQKMLGHAKIATTQIYADVTPERCARAVNELW